MNHRRRILFSWAVVLSALFVLANCWPRGGGVLKADLSWAGFPWAFVTWDADLLERFDVVSLASDVLLGAAVVITVAWACAWSRRASQLPR
jgi:hypothetical protein